MQSAYSTGTRANFHSKIRAYFLFTSFYGLRPYPANEETLCLYAQFLSQTFRSVQAIKSYIQAIKHFHVMSSLSISPFEGPRLELVYRGLARTSNNPPNQAHPLTIELLHEIHAILDFSVSADLVFWSIILLGFFTFARISNLVKTTHNEFQIKRGHVKVDSHMLLLVFTKTKTLQLGNKVLKIPVLSIPSSNLCPVVAYKSMISRIPAPLESPAFVIPKGGTLAPYTYNRFEQKLKNTIAATGRNPRLFSSHSMRRGGASSAFQAGVPTELIQTQGDWASDAYLRYITVSESDRLQVAQALTALTLQHDH